MATQYACFFFFLMAAVPSQIQYVFLIPHSLMFQLSYNEISSHCVQFIKKKNKGKSDFPHVNCAFGECYNNFSKMERNNQSPAKGIKGGRNNLQLTKLIKTALPISSFSFTWHRCHLHMHTTFLAFPQYGNLCIHQNKNTCWFQKIQIIVIWMHIYMNNYFMWNLFIWTGPRIWSIYTILL